ncbi:MAG: hypothetical protein Q8R32_00805 [bacterium]|nr:hypothetical protein [bacterium]
MFEEQSNQFVSRCPLCNAGYRMEDASTLESAEDASMIYIECARCKSSIVAIVAMSGVGVISFGMVTDMTREDVERFRAASSMNSNELLEMIQLLQRKDRSVVRELTHVRRGEDRG